MPQTEPSRQLVLQRIRNRIIENLEILSSFDEQRDYAVRVPIVYVPYELISSREDYVSEPRPSHFSDPVFSEAERNSIQAFHREWNTAADALPNNYLPFEDVLEAPYWAQLRDAASIALKVFAVRGKLSEDVKIA